MPIQTMEKTMSTHKIPTDAIQELAKFWYQHDLTDFKDQLEEVQEPVFKRKPSKCKRWGSSCKLEPTTGRRCIRTLRIPFLPNTQ